MKFLNVLLGRSANPSARSMNGRAASMVLDRCDSAPVKGA